MSSHNKFYLGKTTSIPYLLVWSFAHIWQTSRLDTFSFRRIKQLRTLFTYTFLLALCIQFVESTLQTNVSYDESKTCIGGGGAGDGTGGGMPKSKPVSEYSPYDQQLQSIAEYFGSIGMSLIIVSLWLLQAFWNDLVERVTKRPFMKAWEYKIYFGCCLVALPIFPVLRLIAGFALDSTTLEENLPQLVMSTNTLLISLLGVRIHLRLKKVIGEFTLNISSNLKWKLKYFQDMNDLFTLSLFVYSVCSFLLAVDSILPTQVIQQNKFVTDLLLTHVELSSLIWLVISILIFHPYFLVLQLAKPFFSEPAPNESQNGELPTFKMVRGPSPLRSTSVPPVPSTPSPVQSPSEKQRSATNLTISPSSHVTDSLSNEKNGAPANTEHAWNQGSLTPPPRDPRSFIVNQPNSPQGSFNDQTPLADNASAISSEIGVAITTDTDDLEHHRRAST